MRESRTTRTLKQVAAALVAALGLWAAGTAQAVPASTGDDPEAIAQIMRTANTLSQQFPVLQGTMVYAYWLDADVYAQTNASGITFNKKFTTNLPLWRAEWAADVASGWHPAGCDAPMGTTLHEAAHVIDMRTGFRIDAILLERLADGSLSPNGLSGYSYRNGALNPPEAVSESLLAVQCAPGQATESEKTIYEIIRQVGR